MGVLRELFGPSRHEIWCQIADRIGGELIDRGFWKPEALVFRHGEWQVVLDTYTTSDGDDSTTYTRMRAPFINRDGLRFCVYRAGLFTPLGKLLGTQDITVGDPVFDEDFVVQGNDEARVRLLLRDAEIRRMLQLQPRIRFQVKDDEGWFGPSFPDGADELRFESIGVIKDTVLLEGLFRLFAATLDRLVRIDSAYQDDPQVKLI